MNLRKLAHRLRRPDPGILLDLLIPDLCRVCGAASAWPGYCERCAAALPRHDYQCPLCALPVSAAPVCGRCQRRPPPVVETVAPWRYAAPVSDDIHALKYHRKLAFGRDLGALLARELAGRQAERPAALVPVPLHWKRRLHRGFNQSLEIARPVSRMLDIPIRATLVARRAHTVSQVGLLPAQRRRNLRRAFAHTGEPVPESAAIVDDVITSGATARELARCLRRAGVKRVSVWALARA